MMRVIARDVQPANGYISGKLKVTVLRGRNERLIHTRHNEAVPPWYTENLTVTPPRVKMILQPAY